MTKRRRTRKAKIIAATRRIPLDILIETPLHEVAAPQILDRGIVSASKNYTYVAHDIRKTIVITIVIAILNIALYLTLRFRIINFFNLTF